MAWVICFTVIGVAGLVVIGYFAARVFGEVRRLAKQLAGASARLSGAASVLAERLEQTRDLLPAPRGDGADDGAEGGDGVEFDEDGLAVIEDGVGADDDDDSNLGGADLGGAASRPGDGAALAARVGAARATLGRRPAGR
jgi:hypothetical protein